MTDWDVIRSQYEIQGKSEEDICQEHEVRPAVLQSAIRQGKWQRPDKTASSDGSVDDLRAQAEEIYARHQNTLLPAYIEIETAFLARLKDLVRDFELADEAKKLAETLALIKPSVAAAEGGVDNRVVIVNQFEVPKPGDEDYIAPNAVIVGENAASGVEVVGTDYLTMEVPDPEDMN